MSTTPTNTLIAEIKAAVHGAAAGNQKIAMFHYQVLRNANSLDSSNSEAFCAAINVPKTYQTEFRKMLGLARLMHQQGIKMTAV